jgi:hypothetical protein
MLEHVTAAIFGSEASREQEVVEARERDETRRHTPEMHA